MNIKNNLFYLIYITLIYTNIYAHLISALDTDAELENEYSQMKK